MVNVLVCVLVLPLGVTRVDANIVGKIGKTPPVRIRILQHQQTECMKPTCLVYQLLGLVRVGLWCRECVLRGICIQKSTQTGSMKVSMSSVASQVIRGEIQSLNGQLGWLLFPLCISMVSFQKRIYYLGPFTLGKRWHGHLQSVKMMKIWTGNHSDTLLIITLSPHVKQTITNL